MRGKVNQARNYDKQYTLSRPPDDLLSRKRLDLNDILRRVKDEKKNDKKYNFLIFSGAAFVVTVFYLLLSV